MSTCPWNALKLGAAQLAVPAAMLAQSRMIFGGPAGPADRRRPAWRGCLAGGAATGRLRRAGRERRVQCVGGLPRRANAL